MRIEQPGQMILTPASQTAINQKFAGLKTGGMVQVQVLDISGNQVTIGLQDGEALVADFKGQMLFLPGDSLQLTLESRRAGKVSFRLTSVNGQDLRMEVSGTENLLLRQGIEPTRQNLFLSGLLQKNGYMPTQQNLESLSRIIKEQPELNGALSSFFAANLIEPDSEALALMQRLQAESPQLANQANALLNALQVQFPDAGFAQPLPQAAPAERTSPQAGAEIQKPTQPPIGEQASSLFLQNLQASHPQLAEKLSQAEGFEALQSRLQELGQEEARAALSRFAAGLRLAPQAQKQIASALLSAYAQAFPQDHVPVRTAAPEPQPPLPQLRDMPPAQKTDASAPHSAPLQNPTDLLQKLGEFFAAVNPADIPSTAEALRSAVKKQEKLAGDVQSGIASLTDGKSMLSRQAADIHTQVSLNGLLENFYYVQIPLQFREQPNTAELYVFERAKRSGAASGDCTILVALDMQNMGRIETLLRAEGNSLDLTMRLQQETACTWVQQHAAELKGALASSGFLVKSLSFQMLETKTTPLNAQRVFSDLNSFAPGALDIKV